MGTKRQVPQVCQQQNGYVLAFVLMVLLIIFSIGTVLLKIAFLEMKQSESSARLKQAQQAAQAGIEGTREAIYKELTARANIEQLPATVIAEGGPYSFFAGSSYYYLIEPDGVILDAFSENSCIYGFVCTGWAGDIQSRVKVTCEYPYQQIYEENGSGQKTFIRRIFTNRGKIIRCEMLAGKID